MAKAYVTQYQRQIVLNSQIIEQDEYLKVKAVLQRYKRISEDTFKKDETVDEHTKETIRNSFGIIYDIARSEWKAVEYNEIGNVSCSLCNEPNKIIFYIENTLNGNKLNVGSSCILYFSGLENAISDETIDELIKRTKKSSEKVYRSNTFKNAYPKLDEQLYDFEAVLERSSLLLPEFLYDKLYSNIKNIRTFRTNYLESRIGSTRLLELNTMINDCTNLIDNDIYDWINTNTNNNLVCDIATAQWLQNRGRTDIINELRKNNSLVNRDIVSEIYSPSFIGKHIKSFSDRLSNLFSKIEFRDDQIYVRFKENKISTLRFRASIKDFMKAFGTVIFEATVNIGVTVCLSNIFTIQNDESNIFELALVFDDLFRLYEFLFDSKSRSLYILSKERAMYYKSLSPATIAKYLLPKTMNTSSDIVETTYFKRLSWELLETLDADDLGRLRRAKRESY